MGEAQTLPAAGGGEAVGFADAVLTIKGLVVKYNTFRGELTALGGVDLNVRRSRIIAIVGESGCGKSTLGLSIIRLLPVPPARVAGGEIQFAGKNLVELPESQMTRLRGTGLSMIFQEPLSSLDPVYTVGDQLAETIRVRDERLGKPSYGPFRVTPAPEESHRTASRLLGARLPRPRVNRKYPDEAIKALREVQISDPELVATKYPHELSGGMAQRVMIATALLEKPSLLIADEPTSALDVTTQAQVLELMRELRDEIGASVLFITHDLAVAAQIADEVVVMYAGEIVEHAETGQLFSNPMHPYTEGLLQSFPRKFKDEEKLKAIPGDVPDLRFPPPGCKFHPRCTYAFDRCRVELPLAKEVSPGHRVACFLRQ